MTLPRAPATAAARPGLVCCGARACLSVSQSLAVRLLARDSQALQLKPSCLWFSGCVSGTRLSLKPLIYHLENNQICPGGPLFTYPSPALSSSPWSPAHPPHLILFIVLSSFISSPFFSLSPPPLARPSILLLHHPSPPSPPLSNQHKMVLKLLLALQAAAQATEATVAAVAQAAAVVAAAVYCDWWLALGWSVPLIY